MSVGIVEMEIRDEARAGNIIPKQFCLKVQRKMRKNSAEEGPRP